MRPILDDDLAIEMGLDPLEDEALAITRKNRKDLAKAPQPKAVWQKFTKFVDKYNFKKTNYFAPIPAGYNIIGFDMPIVERMCQEHGPIHAKSGRQGLFNPIHKVDIMDTVWMWMENNADVKSLSMDSMRDLLGMDKENAHDALQDVKDTANLLIAFMKLYRKFAPKVKFEKAFADGNIHL